MDMGCLSFSVWIIICLVESARCSSGENCVCQTIPRLPWTEPPADTGKCFKHMDRFRYSCVKDYVRKVGTSNLITCKNNTGNTGKWTEPSLVCIPHPDRPRPPTSTPETSTSVQSHGSVSPTASLDTTNSIQPTSKEILTQTANSTTQKSTLSPVPDNINVSTEALGQDKVKAVGISLTAVIVIFSMFGLGFFLYRRRSRSNTPDGTAQEMEELKPALQQTK